MIEELDRKIKRLDALILKLESKRDRCIQEKISIETRAKLDPLFEALRGIAMAPIEVREIEDKLRHNNDRK